jgi:hypothetical protein
VEGAAGKKRPFDDARLLPSRNTALRALLVQKYKY